MTAILEYSAHIARGDVASIPEEVIERAFQFVESPDTPQAQRCHVLAFLSTLSLSLRENNQQLGNLEPRIEKLETEKHSLRNDCNNLRDRVTKLESLCQSHTAELDHLREKNLETLKRLREYELGLVDREIKKYDPTIVLRRVSEESVKGAFVLGRLSLSISGLAFAIFGLVPAALNAKSAYATIEHLVNFTHFKVFELGKHEQSILQAIDQSPIFSKAANGVAYWNGVKNLMQEQGLTLKEAQQRMSTSEAMPAV